MFKIVLFADDNRLHYQREINPVEKNMTNDNLIF